MVQLTTITTSNASIPSTLPPGLIAVFIGGTSGIGEVSVKLLAKLAIKPKIYIVGRSAEAAARIIAECRALNAEGEYIFIQKSLGLIREAEEFCEEFRGREGFVNLLFLSVGSVSMESMWCFLLFL